MYNYIKRNKKMIGFLAGFLGTALLTSRRTTTRKSNIVRPKTDSLSANGNFSGVKVSSSKFVNAINSSYGILSYRTNYTGHPVTDGFLHLVWGFEESYKIRQVAYDDKRGNPTIGIGNFTFHKDDGTSWFQCKYGMTLKQIKAKYGRPNQDDKEFCFSIIRNHFKKNVINTVWRQLDEIGVPYNSDFAYALQDFHFNSGRSYWSSHYKTFLNDLKGIKHLSGQSLRVALARAYAKYRINYLKGVDPRLMGGWVRRTQICCERIVGNTDMDWTLSWQLYKTSSSVASRLKSFL